MREIDVGAADEDGEEAAPSEEPVDVVAELAVEIQAEREVLLRSADRLDALQALEQHARRISGRLERAVTLTDLLEDPDELSRAHAASYARRIAGLTKEDDA